MKNLDVEGRGPAGRSSFDGVPTVYSAQFTFVPGEYDDDFDRLNALIDRAAEDNPGFLDRERWISPDGHRRSVVYYWSSMEALEAFSKHPDHLEAKRRYREWYDGYEVIIAKVLHRRGDGRLEERRRHQ